MTDLIVQRKIPAQFVAKVLSGEYTVHGGTIRDARKIVGHLQYADPEALGQLGAPLQPLMQATMALSGLNLAVSVAGFAVVCRKLNRIAASLERVHDKLDELLAGQEDIRRQQELALRTKLEANLKNLAMGLRSGRRHLTEIAIANLTESAEFYQAVATHLLRDLRQVYAEPAPLQQCLAMCLAASLARAQALALDGSPQEAVLIVQELQAWHEARRLELESPLSSRRKPMWLGRLHLSGQSEWQSLVQAHRRVGDGLLYARDQYNLCVSHDVSLDELGRLTEQHRLVLLLPTKNEAA